MFNDLYQLTDKDIVLQKEIKHLKEKNNAYIIVHLYQRPEIQEVADFIGDSYQMALKAKESDAQIIIVAGVTFMAETVFILCPDKKVLIPEPLATCPMAEMLTAKQLIEFKAKYPNAVVVAYVNTSAEVKALVDVCCTSSNATKIINQIPQDKEILFVPDKNLGSYLQTISGRNIISWQGYCPTHNHVSVDEVNAIKDKHPQAKLLVHPECIKEVVDQADFIGSTSAIINYALNSEESDFIIGTEHGVLYPMMKNRNDKNFYLASEKLICPTMKSITLEKIIYCLENHNNQVTVEENIRKDAAKSLNQMIEWTQS
ncbi:Quinolinate synthetase [Candidatus Syntrophocurvum alkaliphilum]|uniref:Quinolinate synthase n=1 Tax=Candidatus Syntrophocurvum alkaliphilum TaxID=2293317 RepID=A0A6I6DDN1_9FIRM|nr:quinolinate synthase NadA [Candidatus Syntrophocurvum alkaliphilum]QGT98912.1 Quinolinate synthetase [Candidatus Syntrophocurvum alkaliphilum]